MFFLVLEWLRGARLLFSILVGFGCFFKKWSSACALFCGSSSSFLYSSLLRWVPNSRGCNSSSFRHSHFPILLFHFFSLMNDEILAIGSRISSIIVAPWICVQLFGCVLSFSPLSSWKLLIVA